MATFLFKALYDDTPGGGGMVDWLELDLQSTDKDWIIAFMHYGPYTKGSHDSDAEFHHIQMRRYVVPLLEKYGVDLVLSGHSHCYERSMLINGHHSHMSTADSRSGTFNTATHVIDAGNGSTVGSVNASGSFVNDGGNGAYEKPLAVGEAGTIYSTCGASGQVSNWTSGSSATVNPSPHPVFLVNLRVMGSMVIDVEGNSLHAVYIDGANTVRDDFTLLKGSTIGITATDGSFAESGSDSSASFTLSRTGATGLGELAYYTTEGSATNGTDYSPTLGGTAPFAANQGTTGVAITRIPDGLAEGPESVILELNPSFRTVADGTGNRAIYFVSEHQTAQVALADAPSQNWWFQSFGAGEPGDAGWHLDTDGDGLDRLKELAFGGTEGTNDRNLLPSLVTTPSAIELHYRRNTAITDLIVQVRHSSDLKVWDDTDISHLLDGDPNPGGIEFWKGVSDIDQPREFLHLELKLPP